MIRLLHTSDWHLGQNLRDTDRTEEHRLFLEWLLAQLENAFHAGDPFHTTLVAGDVFDGPNPSAKAQELYFHFLERARHFTKVIVTAGNHDSAERLSAPAPLLGSLGIAVSGGWPSDPDMSDLYSTLQDRIIPIQGCDESALVLAMPFLRLGDLGSFSQEDAATHFIEAHRKRYQELVESARRHPHWTSSITKPALIAMGHAFVSGATVNEETERRVGHQDELPQSIFPEELVYVALGHLHKAQKVGTTGKIRYPGSILPLGFSEANYRHQVLDVRIAQGSIQSIEPLEIPRFRSFLIIPARHAPWSEVEPLLRALPSLQGNDANDPLRPLLEVRIDPAGSAHGLRDRVQEALADRWPKLFRIDLQRNEDVSQGDDNTLNRSLEEENPTQVFLDLCKRQGMAEDSMQDLLADFQLLLDQANEAGNTP